MIKNVTMVNIKSMNELPLMERWLRQVHCPETISSVGPWLTRYQSYRVMPPPPGMYTQVQKYGYYNWRVTELWWRSP
jgi:hypothetical protein